MHTAWPHATGGVIGAAVITLTLKEPVELVPLEAEVLCPDTMAALDHAAIRALPVYLGKKQCRIDDFFTVDGEISDELEIRGELKKVRWIGRGMSRGRINYRRQRRDASRRLHEGRDDRSVRQRLGLGRRRDVGRIHPDCRARRRPDRRRLSRQSNRDDQRHHRGRGIGGPGNRDAHEARDHRRSMARSGISPASK